MCLYRENEIMLTRRAFIRAAGLTFTGLAVPTRLAAQNRNNPKNKPNVLIVLTDDQGYGDLSCHGNPILKTPNLDALHQQSIHFTDFHVAPMCTPTRGQLLTGRDAMANGATFVCMGRSMMRNDLPTMADVFAANGYHTGHFGKWHLGDSYPHRPQDRGFQETINHGAWGITSIADYYGNDYWDDTYRHNYQLEEYKGYCTDVWFDEAMDYMKVRHANNEPFFVYLPTNCPHSPHWVIDKHKKWLPKNER
jgi:arylsulfatase A-like enzyme